MRCLRVGRAATWSRHSPKPRHAGLLGAQADLPVTHALTHLVEQTGRTGRRTGGWDHDRFGAVPFQHAAGESSAQEPSRGLAAM